MNLYISDGQKIVPCPNCYIELRSRPSAITCFGCLENYIQRQGNCQRSECLCREPETCLKTITFNEYVRDNSEFYSETDVRTAWPSIPFDTLKDGDRVVAQFPEGEQCLNCYGYSFPCSQMCATFDHNLMGYSEYLKLQCISQKLLPTDYRHFTLLPRK